MCRSEEPYRPGAGEDIRDFCDLHGDDGSDRDDRSLQGTEGVKSLRVRRAWLRFAVLDSTGSATSSTRCLQTIVFRTSRRGVEASQTLLHLSDQSSSSFFPLGQDLGQSRLWVLAPFPLVACASGGSCVVSPE